MGFSTSVFGVLGMIPWIKPEQIEAFVSAGRLHEIFSKSMEFYKNRLVQVNKMSKDASWDYA
jgi:hypothetical protein